MKSSHNPFLLPTILFLLLTLSSACHLTHEVEIVPVNSELTGIWSVQSYQVAGEEQMGEYLKSFEIDFVPEEASSGMSVWALTSSHGESSEDSNFYTLSADASTMLLDGEEYNLSMDKGELILDCQSNGGCLIVAEKN